MTALYNSNLVSTFLLRIDPDVTVSIIIPTYNGAHRILNVLRSLEQQTYVPDEIIVVIDGSTDNTRKVLYENGGLLKRVKIIEQENGGRAKVRNRGAEVARGDLLIFFDDDMRPASDCVSVHVKHHQHNAGSILTGAQMEEIHNETPDFVKFKASLSRKWYQSYREEPKIKTEEQLFLTAANLSIPNSLFQALGGFDERLTDAEDYDLAVRAFEAQIPMYVKPEAHALHDDPVTCARYVLRQRQYLKAHQLLHELKPQLYSSRQKYLPKQPVSIKRFIFAFFSQPFWVRMADLNWYFKVLPRTFRYKLYDIIVTAHYLKTV